MALHEADTGYDDIEDWRDVSETEAHIAHLVTEFGENTFTYMDDSKHLDIATADTIDLERVALVEMLGLPL